MFHIRVEKKTLPSLQHVAAAAGYDDCVRFLLTTGADVNVKGKRFNILKAN